jgi:lysyl-tRNA synthetase class 1
MHWADVFAEKLLKEGKEHVLATGITPSGPIHIGNMREILTTDAIYRSLVEKGADVDFIYIADDFDPLRKVYPYLPSHFEEYVGKPISEIPCVCGNHNSYADHYLFSFLESLEDIGVNPRIYRASEMYKSGDYNESIQVALENSDKIRKIIEEVSQRKLPREWIPFNVKCGECGRLTTTKPVLYEYPIIEYKCECKHEGEVNIREGGVGKLPWRVDWPARWKMLSITFEPCGKDLATAGGARDTGARIVEEIYEYPHPALLVYEFILLKGKGAMHSSKGTALSAEEMLKITPPQVLRFLMIKNQPNKHIEFDSGFGLLNLIDEYDREERVYFSLEEKKRGMKDLRRTYELSQPYTVPERMPFQLPYRHLVTLIQIGRNWKEVRNILLRTGHDLKKEDEELLKQRIERVKYWLDNFAPDSLKFEVKKSMPDIKLTEEQKFFLSNMYEKLKEVAWEPEKIHNMIYEISEEKDVPIKSAFKAIYQILLGQEEGPRAGYFLSSLGREFVLGRVKEAIK